MTSASIVCEPWRILHQSAVTRAFQKSGEAVQNHVLRRLRMGVEVTTGRREIRVAQAQNQPHHQSVDDRHGARGVTLFQLTPVFA